MTTRAYNSPRREADAAATRERIVDAAGRLFVRDGYAATSMKAIAAEAGVSVPTVHLNGPKHALLIAAFERAFAGDEGRHSLTERPAIQSIIAEPDDATALAQYVSFLADANARAAGIVRAMTLAADADPGARSAYLDLEERRRRDMLLGARFLVQRGLIPAAELERTAQLLGLYTGPDAYLHLVEASGWTRAQYEDWLRAAIRNLFVN